MLIAVFNIVYMFAFDINRHVCLVISRIHNDDISVLHGLFTSLKRRKRFIRNKM